MISERSNIGDGSGPFDSLAGCLISIAIVMSAILFVALLLGGFLGLVLRIAQVVMEF